MEITFEQLPQAVKRLFEKLEHIEQMLTSHTEESKPEPDKMLTIRQAAEILHLSVPTVYGLVQRAEVPVCKRGNRLYFSSQDLMSWIKAGRKKTLSEIKQERNSYLSGQKRKPTF